MCYVGDAAQSKSKPLASHMGNAGVWVGSLWCVSAMLLVTWVDPSLPLVWGTLGCLVCLGYMAWRCQERLGGFTGDVLGATQQLAEIGFYLGLVVASGAR
jgi:adenosylcobinamide-GDP ribazoletransferase